MSHSSNDIATPLKVSTEVSVIKNKHFLTKSKQVSKTVAPLKFVKIVLKELRDLKSEVGGLKSKT